jgi:hypothetical protein
MTRHEVDKENPIRQRMAEEEKVRQEVDESGNRWTKVYFGGGAHFRNWPSQFVGLKREDNVRVGKRTRGDFSVMKIAVRRCIASGKGCGCGTGK